MSDIMLKQGDCLELMKQVQDNSIDLILTDIPYEYDNHGGGKNELGNRKLTKDKHIDFMSSGIPYNEVFNEFIRICKTPNLLIFCSNKQIAKIMTWFENSDNIKNVSVTLLCWNKTNPIPACNGKYLSDLEFIVYVRGKGATFNNDTPFEYKHKCYISPIVSSKNRLHPAQKPIELLERYVLLHSKEDDTILDCFMGSGSTGIACMNTNRNFIGFELDENYFKIAKDRIEGITNTSIIDSVITSSSESKQIKRLF